MKSNGVKLHDVESDGVHFNLLEESAPDATVGTEPLRITAPRLAPDVESPPDPTTLPPEAGSPEVVEALQALEAQAWDVKKRCEVLQDMVEDVAESPTMEPSHREPLLETAKTLCTDLQDLYRTIRAVLKVQAPDYHTAVWKKSSRSRK
jgi:hypothetical protein